MDFTRFSTLARDAVAAAVQCAALAQAESISPEHLIAGVRTIALPDEQPRERVVPEDDDGADATFRKSLAPSTLAILEDAAGAPPIGLPELVAAIRRGTGDDLGALADAAARREAAEHS